MTYGEKINLQESVSSFFEFLDIESLHTHVGSVKYYSNIMQNPTGQRYDMWWQNRSPSQSDNSSSELLDIKISHDLKHFTNS